MTDKPLIGGNGAEGSNSNRVFTDHFDANDHEYDNAGTFPALFEGLISGKYNQIVVPTSNVIIGDIPAVAEVMQGLAVRGVELETQVSGIEQLIEHALIGGPSASLDTVKVAISYTAALDQCIKTTTKLGLKTQYHDDTYGAAVDVVAKNDPAEAAIAPIGAAADLGGVVLAENISDVVPNITYFSIFSLK